LSVTIPEQIFELKLKVAPAEEVAVQSKNSPVAPQLLMVFELKLKDTKLLKTMSQFVKVLAVILKELF
jgi:hypothetical protein